MQLDYRERVALITGASTGIGAAVAKGFARAGATTIVHYNSSEAAANDVVAAVRDAGGEAYAVRYDLSLDGAAQALVTDVVERWGKVDVLVNNAGGIVRRSSIADMSDELYGHVLDLNVRSVFQACRAVIPHMVERRSGTIVNVASVAARNGGAGGAVLYAAAKAAVATLTRGLSRELAPDGIRVNALSPGLIDTPFHSQTDADVFAKLAASIPLGRAARPEECVGPVLFLASEEAASYVTGQVLEVNGGQLAP